MGYSILMGLLKLSELLKNSALFEKYVIDNFSGVIHRGVRARRDFSRQPKDVGGPKGKIS